MNFNNVKLTKTCYLKEQLFKSYKKEIVFVGCSNVGKSSIINKVLNRKKLARVSNKPGKTVSINFYDVGEIYLVDFPGYGFAKVNKQQKKNWNVLAEEYFSSKRQILMAVLILDCRQQVKSLDFEMIKYLISKDISFVVLLNKIDKLKKSEFETILLKTKGNFKFINNLKIMLFSARTGEGVEELRNFFEKICKEK